MNLRNLNNITNCDTGLSLLLSQHERTPIN